MMAVVSVVLGLIVIAGVAIGILKLVDWLTLKGWRKNDDGSAWRARLHHPDFPSLEKHFGCKAPESLKRLYADHEELERGNFTLIAPDDEPDDERSHFVGFYVPADMETVKWQYPGTERFWIFADDGCGNGYMTDPAQEDGAVFFHDHETGEISEICDSLVRFMSWERSSA